MSESDNPLDHLLVQNMALRNILQQVIVQCATASNQPNQWLSELKARLAALDYVRANVGNPSQDSQQLTQDVAAAVDKIIGKLRL